MKLTYKKAEMSDAALLADLYNASFYQDYMRYGECPGYGKTKEIMERSIVRDPKFIILRGDRPVGAISVKEEGSGVYEIGCLCVIPEYQGKGIGTESVRFLLSYLDGWKRITLKTPADKEENVRFYTEKCGFSAGPMELDGSVPVIRFYMER